MKYLIQVLFVCFMMIAPGSVYSKVIYSLDFNSMKDGDAKDWLEQNEFIYKLDADQLQYSFKNGSLIVSNPGDTNGLLYKEVNIKNAKRVRIEWAVNKYPAGIEWDKGFYKDVIMLIITFGEKKIDSGSFIIPNLPYFIGLFLAENEVEGKAYTGSYYKKGGRYFCTPCGAPAGKPLVTEFELHDRFKTLFGQPEVPPISAIAIETDTRDFKESTEAYINKIEFLSE